jgi:hypothetical protein
VTEHFHEAMAMHEDAPLVTIGDCRIAGKLLEIGCEVCGRHGYLFKGVWKAGRRCLVLAGGFFEWRKAGVADKQPFAFAMGNHEIMTLAGLWEAWKNPDDRQWLRSCTIITTEANEMMAPIHNRMPVIIGSEDWEKWLGEEPANDNELKAMLKPFPSERMKAWPVNKGGRQCEERRARSDRAGANSGVIDLKSGGARKLAAIANAKWEGRARMRSGEYDLLCLRGKLTQSSTRNWFGSSRNKAKDCDGKQVSSK